MNKSTLGAIALALLGALGLAACGSGGSSSSGPLASTPDPVIDSFFAAVSGIVSTTSEDGAPTDPIDTIVATTPEDNEPQPLG